MLGAQKVGEVSKPQGSSILHLPNTGIRSIHTILGFLCEFWGLNSSAYACLTNTLLTELSPARYLVPFIAEWVLQSMWTLLWTVFQLTLGSNRKWQNSHCHTWMALIFNLAYNCYCQIQLLSAQASFRGDNCAMLWWRVINEGFLKLFEGLEPVCFENLSYKIILSFKYFMKLTWISLTVIGITKVWRFTDYNYISELIMNTFPLWICAILATVQYMYF